MMEMIHYSAVASIFWSVFCRARRMNESTASHLKLQYGIVLVLSLLSLPAFGVSEYAGTLLGLALCAYLIIDSRRWRGDGVPVAVRSDK